MFEVPHSGFSKVVCVVGDMWSLYGNSYVVELTYLTVMVRV